MKKAEKKEKTSRFFHFSIIRAGRSKRFLYTYRHLWWFVLILCGMILLGVLADYFLFHYTSDRMKELIRVNKELTEWKENNKK